jgi:hypothetical protein
VTRPSQHLAIRSKAKRANGKAAYAGWSGRVTQSMIDEYGSYDAARQRLSA